MTFDPDAVSMIMVRTVLPRTEEGRQQNVGLPLRSSKSCQSTRHKDREEKDLEKGS